MRKIEQYTTGLFWTNQTGAQGNSAVSSTRLESGEMSNCYQLHQTVVVQKIGDVIRLNSGGWQTPTTKSRINAVLQTGRLSWRVYQKDWEWFLWNYETEAEYPFYDHMTINMRTGEVSYNHRWCKYDG